MQQNRWRLRLTKLPIPLNWVQGAYFRGPTFKGRGKGRKGRGAKMIYASGARNPRADTGNQN